MFLIPFRTSIDVFAMFRSIFWCFRPLFLSKIIKNPEKSSKPPNKHKILRKSLKIIENHISFHYMIVLHVSDTFSDYYRCFYDVLKRFLCFYITFWVQNDIIKTKMVRSNKSQNHRKYFKIVENHTSAHYLSVLHVSDTFSD